MFWCMKHIVDSRVQMGDYESADNQPPNLEMSRVPEMVCTNAPKSFGWQQSIPGGSRYIAKADSQLTLLREMDFVERDVVLLRSNV